MRILFFTLIIWSFSVCLFACEPEPGAQHFPTIEVPPARIKRGFFKVYNQLNGLPCNAIRSLLIFNSGEHHLVVAGTLNRGIMVFDEGTWFDNKDPMQRIVFPDVTVTSLVAADKNLIYAGTPDGLMSIKFESGKFALEKIFSDSPENLNVSEITLTSDKDSSLLLACDRSVGTFKNDAYQRFFIPEYMTPTGFNTIIKRENIILTGCSDGLYKMDEGNLSRIDDKDNSFGWVNSLRLHEKTVYAASSEGVFQLDENMNRQAILPGIWSTCLTMTAQPVFNRSKGQIQAFEELDDYVISQEQTPEYQSLLAEYNQLQADYTNYISDWSSDRAANIGAANELWRRFSEFETRKQLLLKNGAITENTMEKGLWIGTQDAGLIMFSSSGKRFHMTVENSKLPADHVTCMTSGDNGEVWIGTENAGILHYSKRTKKQDSKEILLTNCRPLRIKVLSDMLFICTENQGLQIYQSENRQFIGAYDSKNTAGFTDRVNDVNVDIDGNIWVATQQGLMIWNGKTWKKVLFRSKGAANLPFSRIEIDSKNRIYAATTNKGSISDNVFFFNGTEMVGLGKEDLIKVLNMKGKKRQEAADQFGLTGNFMRTFDFANASEALKLYDNSSAETITSLLNTENYLLIGTEKANQYIFDGQSFKKLSIKGFGRIGAVRSLARLPEGEIVIQGSEAVTEFNGQHYNLINSPGIGGKSEISQLIIDTMNPETYRIAFKFSDQGGYALYQEPNWVKYFTDKPVLSIAQSDKIIYMAKPDGVFYLEE